MKIVLLTSEETVAGIIVILVISVGSFIFFSVTSWLTGTKIKSRYGGIEYGSPDTIPAIFNFLSNSSKSIYNKIQSKIGADKYKQLSSTTDKIHILKQLGELKENNTITNEEFELLKKDILQKQN